MPQAGIDPPFAENNNLLIEKVDALTNQATTARLQRPFHFHCSYWRPLLRPDKYNIWILIYLLNPI